MQIKKWGGSMKIDIELPERTMVTSFNDINKHVVGVKLMHTKHCEAGILEIEILDGKISLSNNCRMLAFPQSIVRNTYCGPIEQCGLGLHCYSIEFDSGGEKYIYIIIKTAESNRVWLDGVALQISELCGLSLTHI